MNKLAITADGKLSLDDYRSIHRAILLTLNNGSKCLLELVSEIHKNYHEFKYIKHSIIVRALADLLKAKLVVSSYCDDFVIFVRDVEND